MTTLADVNNLIAREYAKLRKPTAPRTHLVRCMGKEKRMTKDEIKQLRSLNFVVEVLD